MSNFEGVSKVQRKEIESETIAAISEGRAMPLPEFLNENSEARAAFLEALTKSKELSDSLKQLTPEERLAMLAVFSEVLDKPQPTTMENIAAIINGSVLSVGIGMAGAGYQGDNMGLFITGCGAIMMSVNLLLNQRGMEKLNIEQRDAIKKQLLEAATA